MKKAVKAWLETGRVDIFIGFRMLEGHPMPDFLVNDKKPEVEVFINGDSPY